MKSFKILTNEIKKKDGSGTFTAYKAVKKDGTTIDCKFRKEIRDLPDNNDTVFVDETKMNVQRNRQYPVLWITEIDHIEKNVYAADVDLFDEMF